VTHGGGVSASPGSSEEALLRQWIQYLAAMPEDRARRAAQYSKSEATSYDRASRAVLRRLTHQQYSNTVRDLLKEATTLRTSFRLRISSTVSRINTSRNLCLPL
jgi:hypothetical protein